MIELAIVTSCHGYGEYLEEWADSIIAQTMRPVEIAIATGGAPADRLAAEEAAGKLRGAAFHVKLSHLEGERNLGVLRNAAVALSRAPWVMHLDADDELLPHAVADIDAIAPGADIVALGYIRSGDRKAGPRQTIKSYASSTGAEILANPTPCSGVSPFRRWLWERAPYRVDLIGGWDTALWLGFAHLGARIRPTRRPAFQYRQHFDSVFNTRRKSIWNARRAGMKLQSLRRGDSGVAILVPWAPDGAERDRAWGWIRQRYAALVPEWEIRLGACPRRGPWRKGVALAAALEGCKAEIVIVADADCLVPIEALREAVRLVRAGAPWVIPHGLVHRLEPIATAELLAQDPATASIAPDAKLARPSYRGFAGGGMLVVGKAELQATGGIPSAFAGWGAEDEALAVILDSLIGPHTRLEADLLHCWHPAQPGRTGPHYRTNRALLQRYRQAASDPEALWAMVSRGSSGDLDPYLDPTTRLETYAARARSIRDDAAGVRDSFAERRLAKQFTGGGSMALALELKHAHRAKRLAQAARNLAAQRPDHKALLAPPQHTARLEEPILREAGAIKFASPSARNAAMGSGLGMGIFAELAARQEKGLTLAQVREVIG